MEKIRPIVSLTLLVLFIISAVTGVLLIFASRGKGTTGRTTLANIHAMSSILMLIPAILHTYLNAKALKVYSKKLLGK